MILPEIYTDANAWVFNDKDMKANCVQFKGVTLHYTADRLVWRVLSSLNDRKLGYHFLIERNGDVIQTAKLSRTVSHAGRAEWRGHSPNDSHIAISLVSWGHLNHKHKSWTGEYVNGDEVEIRRALNGSYVPWDVATKEQESALWELLKWLVSKGIDSEHICGHDECCIPPGRKVDPGGVVSMPMVAIRKRLR
jgi:N-acetyl-anhydromuramyl-L-alanine amidase AmpD